eukprot:1175687-Prorocentrum_lima.AAC.1
MNGNDNRDNNIVPKDPTIPTCRFFTKTGTCRFGDRCRFVHVPPPSSSSKTPSPTTSPSNSP